MVIAAGVPLVRSRSLGERFGGLGNRGGRALPLGRTAIVTALGVGIALNGPATYLG